MHSAKLSSMVSMALWTLGSRMVHRSPSSVAAGVRGAFVVVVMVLVSLKPRISGDTGCGEALASRVS